MVTYETKVGRISDGHANYREGYEWTGVCTCGFASYGWPEEEQAQMRIDSHLVEHNTGELMPPKEEVEALTPDKFAGAPAPTPESVPLWSEVH